MSYQTVLFDFDGVLCKEKFYNKTLLPDYQDIYGWIQMNIFGDKELVWKWMRGKINSAGINRLVSENTGMEYEKLNELYNESVRGMKLESEVIDMARRLKQSGGKIGIVTDNMDIFSQITVFHHQLDKLFDVIINSADQGMLKKDENGKLFDIALAALGENIENSLMIDDSSSTIELFRQKGGQGYCFRTTDELKLYLEN